MKQEKLFVGIKDYKKVRRSVLLSSKGCIQMLKNYQSLLSTRDEKIDAAEQLSKTLKEINSLNRSLSKLVPADEIKGLMPKEKKHKKSAVKHIRRQVYTLDHLEDELSKIEEKLGNL